MKFNLEELYEQYQQISIPNKFTFKEVKEKLTKEYLAKQTDKKDIDFLLAPDEINDYKQSFIIDNIEILQLLFSEEEKNGLYNLKNLNKKYPLNVKEASKSEIEYTRIQEGEYLVIFLDFNERNYINGFKLLGNSRKLYYQLVVFSGICNKDLSLDNRDFQEYLIALSNLGYLEQHN